MEAFGGLQPWQHLVGRQVYGVACRVQTRMQLPLLSVDFNEDWLGCVEAVAAFEVAQVDRVLPSQSGSSHLKTSVALCEEASVRRLSPALGVEHSAVKLDLPLVVNSFESLQVAETAELVGVPKVFFDDAPNFH